MSGGATEWEDLLIQHGILKAPQNPKEQEPEIVYDITDAKSSASDLDGLSDDEEFLKTYRQQRLKELSGQMSANFSGQVTEISRPDFVTEVSEASRSHFVLVHLYQSGLAACQLVSRALRDLCGEYPQVKFVEIASTRCIENYPDRLLPTILIYKETNVYTQVTNATPDKVKRLLETIQEHLNEAEGVSNRMMELSQFVPSSAVISIESLEWDKRKYLFLNKYNRLVICILDVLTCKLKALEEVDFGSGILGLRLLIDNESCDLHVLLANNCVQICPFINGKLVFKDRILFPSQNGHAYAPSFIEVIPNFVVLGSYRGAVIVKNTAKDTKHEIPIDGTLLLMKSFNFFSTDYLFLVTQSDKLDESGLIVYQMQESGKVEFLTSYRLPTISEFLTPNHMIQLGDFVMIISECKGILLKLEGAELEVKNEFHIKTLPPGSYTEAQTCISALTQVFATSFGEAFFASTNKGELLLFEHRTGQVVISPINIVGLENNMSNLFSCLCYFDGDSLLIAPGENMDGAIFKFSPPYTMDFQMSIQNWSPIINLDSNKMKGGQIVASSGVPAICGFINLVRKGIPNSYIFQSDPCFKGVTKLWALKRYSADKFHGYIVTSFAQSTAFFTINRDELELFSGCGLETCQPSLLVDNLPGTSFWLQVCPDRILVVKICEPDTPNPPTATIWRPDMVLITTCALVKDILILFDDVSKSIIFLRVTCQISRGTADFTELGRITGTQKDCSALAVLPLNLGPRPEFFLVAGFESEILSWNIQIDEMFTSQFITRNEIDTSVRINSLALWTKGELQYLGVGLRDGSARFFSHPSLQLLKSMQVGNAPVRMVLFKGSGEDQNVCCTSRGVWFVDQSSDDIQLEKFHPHVDCFVDINLQSHPHQRTFATTKKEFLTIIEAELEPSSWLYRLFSGDNLRKVALYNGTAIVTSISSPAGPIGQQNSLELLQLSELETVLRLKIPAHVSSICPLKRPGYYAISSIDNSGQGAVHVYSCEGQVTAEKDRHQKRRGSVSDAKRQLPSFSYVSASSGFYSGISAMCEILDGVILLSCDTDIYLLKLNFEDLSFQILRSEPRRSKAYCISSWRLSDSVAKVAIYDEDGLEVLEVDIASNLVFKHLRGDTKMRSGGKCHWLDGRYLLATEKTGAIAVLDTADPTSIWLKTAAEFKLNDIPYSICSDPHSEASALIGTMLGGLYKLKL